MKRIPDPGSDPVVSVAASRSPLLSGLFPRGPGTTTPSSRTVPVRSCPVSVPRMWRDSRSCPSLEANPPKHGTARTRTSRTKRAGGIAGRRNGVGRAFRSRGRKQAAVLGRIGNSSAPGTGGMSGLIRLPADFPLGPCRRCGPRPPVLSRARSSPSARSPAQPRRHSSQACGPIPCGSRRATCPSHPDRSSNPARSPGSQNPNSRSACSQRA